MRVRLGLVHSTVILCCLLVFFFSSRRRHTRLVSDWSSDVCSSDLSSIFFSRKESSLSFCSLCSSSRVLKTSAARRRLPPSIFSEFALKRTFQSLLDRQVPVAR